VPSIRGAIAVLHKPQQLEPAGWCAVRCEQQRVVPSTNNDSTSSPLRKHVAEGFGRLRSAEQALRGGMQSAKPFLRTRLSVPALESARTEHAHELDAALEQRKPLIDLWLFQHPFPRPFQALHDHCKPGLLFGCRRFKQPRPTVVLSLPSIRSFACVSQSSQVAIIGGFCTQFAGAREWGFVPRLCPLWLCHNAVGCGLASQRRYLLPRATAELTGL